jgi:hypothetical protein
MTAAIAPSPPPPTVTVPAPLAAALDPFAPPSAELLAARELMRRIDSKFVVRTSRLPALIAGLERDYAAFRVAAGAVADYQSLYLDTPDLTCFHDHRRGKRLRHKVRVRHYPDRGLSFLEIKSKRSDLVTHKHRIAIPYGSEAIGAPELAFLRGHLGAMAEALRPELRVNYRRIGLVALATDERVTIDVELDFITLDGTAYRMPEAAIVEVKQAGATRTSPIMRRLAEAGTRECSLSKYTTAIATTRPGLPRNRLLVDLKAIARILAD